MGKAVLPIAFHDLEWIFHLPKDHKIVAVTYDADKKAYFVVESESLPDDYIPILKYSAGVEITLDKKEHRSIEVIERK